jgi:hypothetical protein
MAENDLEGRTRKAARWDRPCNPLGNYREPLPTPEARMEQAKASHLPVKLWWWLRNPASNFCDFWVGLWSISPNGAVQTPGENGWHFIQGTGHWSVWIHPGNKHRLYYRRDGKRWTCYIGWRSNGSFGLALRRV